MRLLMMLVMCVLCSPGMAMQCLTVPSANNVVSQMPANNKLTRSQEQSLNRLFHDLARSWIGKATGFYCIGEEISKAHKEYQSFDLALAFSNDTPGILETHMSAVNRDKLTQRLASLTIYANEGYLRFDQNNEAGDVWIENLSSTHLNVWSMTRSGTVYHLINREIKRTQGAFNLTVTTYSNNRLTSHYTGRLTY